MVQNKIVRIKKTQPAGEVTNDNVEIVTEATPELKVGEVLVKNLYLSIDPTHRIYISGEPSYFPPFKAGDKMSCRIVGEVVESKASDLPVGVCVSGWGSWEEYAVVPAADMEKLDPKDVPLEGVVAVMNLLIGLVAWAGIREVLGINKGEGKGKVVCVSGASGAVGTIACQIAKSDGAKVIGIAGGDDKCQLLKEIGCDVIIDYKKGDFAAELKAKCPEKITHYFENVGGKITEAVLAHMALQGKVALCGFIDQYNKGDECGRIKAWDQILFNRLMVKGLICVDHVASIPVCFAELGALIKENKLTYKTNVLEGGVERCVEGLVSIMNATRTGKVMVKLAEPTNKEYKLK